MGLLKNQGKKSPETPWYMSWGTGRRIRFCSCCGVGGCCGRSVSGCCRRGAGSCCGRGASGGIGWCRGKGGI